MFATRRPRTCARRQSPRLHGIGIKSAPLVRKRRHSTDLLALLRACSPGKLRKGPRAKAIHACAQWIKAQNFNLKALRAAARQGQRKDAYTQAYFDHLDRVIAKLAAPAPAPDSVHIQIEQAPGGGIVSHVLVQSGGAPAPAPRKRIAKNATAAEMARLYGAEKHSVGGKTVFVSNYPYKCDIDVEGRRRSAVIFRRMAVESKSRVHDKVALMTAVNCHCPRIQCDPQSGHKAGCIYADPDYPAALAAFRRYGAPCGPWVDIITGPASAGVSFFKPCDAARTFGSSAKPISFTWFTDRRQAEFDVVTKMDGAEEISEVFRNRRDAGTFTDRHLGKQALLAQGDSETESESDSD